MHPAGFEPAIPASERQQIRVSDHWSAIFENSLKWKRFTSIFKVV